MFGGSQLNCGTWMDKTGESEKARSKGVPGTPQDGAAVEITGLLYSSLKWVAGLYQSGQHEHEGVNLTDEKSITFKEWGIKRNFERCYYIPLNPEEDFQHDLDPALVSRLAPDLFIPSNALHALSVADTTLLGPIGMATLDPADPNYRPNYNNSEDSTNFATAKGRNYH
ncbi:Glycogen debranching enzyme [Elaphomyces granulatus]